MSTIFEHFEAIANTAGKKDKANLLAECMNEHPKLTEQIFTVLLDKKISTYITEFPAPSAAKLGFLAENKSTITLDEVLQHHIDHGKRYNKVRWQEVSDALSQTYNPEQMKWIGQIMTKDLNIGASYNTYNTAAGISDEDIEPIIEFKTVKVSNVGDDTIDYSKGAYVGIKKDGANATAHRGFLISRNGNSIPLEHIEDAIEPISDKYVLMGELVSHDNRQKSNGIVNSAIKKGYEASANVGSLQLHVFDCLTVEDYELLLSDGIVPQMPFPERIKMASEVVSDLDESDILIVEQTLVHSYEEALEIYDEVIANGEEGIIINSSTMLFELKRSKQRARIKEIIEADFEIFGFTDHKKKPNWIGSVLVRTRDEIVECGVGSGLNDDQRFEFYENRKELLGKIVKVKYNKVIKDSEKEGKFSLFLPVFNSSDLLRHDKEIADDIYEIGWGEKNKLRKKLFGA